MLGCIYLQPHLRRPWRRATQPGPAQLRHQVPHLAAWTAAGRIHYPISPTRPPREGPHPPVAHPNPHATHRNLPGMCRDLLNPVPHTGMNPAPHTGRAHQRRCIWVPSPSQMDLVLVPRVAIRLASMAPPSAVAMFHPAHQAGGVLQARVSPRPCMKSLLPPALLSSFQSQTQRQLPNQHWEREQDSQKALHLGMRPMLRVTQQSRLALKMTMRLLQKRMPLSMKQQHRRSVRNCQLALLASWCTRTAAGIQHRQPQFPHSRPSKARSIAQISAAACRRLGAEKPMPRQKNQMM